jgi:hypothetical protein
MILTTSELNVLNHVVINGQEWADERETLYGLAKAQELVAGKVSNHQVAYDEAVAAGSCQSRQQKDDKRIQGQLDRFATDLAAGKRAAKSFIAIGVKTMFNKYIDPSYLKYHRKLARGGQPTKPGSAITDYENILTTNQDSANTAIDALTTVKQCYDFNGMVWPTPPTVYN